MKKLYEDIKIKRKGSILFKRDLNGNILYWYALVEEFTKVIKVFHGRYHNNFMSDECKSSTEITKGKNIGQSNETNVLEQAYKEFDSTYKDHIKKGYKEYKSDIWLNPELLNKTLPKDNTDINGMAKPMKCQKFEIGKVKYPALIQPKLNGVRCINFLNPISTDLFNSKLVDFLSKEGISYDVAHLQNICETLLLSIKKNHGIENPILDGELYIPYTPVTSIGGSARNSVNPLNKRLQFVVFDLSIENYSNKQRNDILMSYITEGMLEPHNNITSEPTLFICPSCIINNDDEALEYTDRCLKNGYEGAVVRQLDTEYCFGQRPSTMRKIKRFEDAEFEILDIVEYGDRTQNVGYGCKIICRNDLNNLTFEATSVGTKDYKQSLVDRRNKLIGKPVTVKFYERTINNLPFHANALGIRDYE